MSIWLTTKETVDRQTTNLQREPSSSNLLEMAKDRHGDPHLPLGALCVQGTQRIFWGGELMVGAMEMVVGVKLNLGSVISGDNHE
jgi:hypothetical protein